MPSAGKDPTAKAPEIKVGDLVLDRYRVVEQIGTGGHSVVFKGSDERLQRPVCIKVFSGLGGETGVGRTSYEHFVQEAFALSRLTHPNTLRIYDFGHLGNKDAAGLPLQVCEYMNGGTLSNIVRDLGKQSLAETVRITSAMCAALAEAHGLGIVHRDIKPQNILFGSTKLPKLADFGIAKWTVDDEQAKKNIAEDTAIVAGQKLAMYSPSWAAPEQLAGQLVNASTDIYSLAVVAIYMLTGRAIFADEDVYAGYKKRRHSDDHITDSLKALPMPRQLVEVLKRAIAFDPKKRIDKVEDFAAELATASEPSTEEQPRQPAPPRRNSVNTAQTVPLGRSFTLDHNAEVQLTPTTPVAAVTPPGGEPIVRVSTPSGAVALASEPSLPPPGMTPVPGLPPAPPGGGSTPMGGVPHLGSLGAPPQPGVPRQGDRTPQAFHAPAVTPWMSGSPTPTGTAVRIALSDVPTPAATRRLHFALCSGQASVDITGAHGTKVRVTLLAGPGGQRVVHVKGLSCFVAILGGRPSPAVTIDRTADIALVTPRAQEIGHLRVAQGTSEGGLTSFSVGADLLAVATEDCIDPILFDFGPGSDAYFVYTRGRTPPKSGRRG